MPTLYMLCGVPYSGKTTWTNKMIIKAGSGNVLSTDDTIEAICRVCATSYGDSFDNLIKYAEMILDLDLKDAIKRNGDIIWDQTNLTKKSRAKKLKKIPPNYKKVAVNFTIPGYDEMKRRVEQRQDKIIPWSAMERMFAQYEPATLEEGFDEIIEVKNDNTNSNNKKAKKSLEAQTVYWC